MSTPLRVLLVEDDPERALTLRHHLARAGYDVDARRVDSPEALREALAEPWDLVVSGRAPSLMAASAGEALVDRARILAGVVDGMADGVAVTDPEGRIMLFNRAAERLLGAAPGPVHPYDWSRAYGLYLPDGQTPFPAEQSPLVRALGGEESRDVELLVRNERVPEGVFVSAIGTPLRDESGAVRGGVVVLRDVTERRRAEETLRRTEERFLHAQKMEAIGRLAGGVAHDFNNIMSIISNYASLLRADLPPGAADAAAALDEITRAAARATRLTRQLLTFSYRHATRVGAVDLNAVVADVEKLLRRLLGEDVELVVHAHPGAAHVRGDAGQVEQVLMNLAVNARDAMPEGGRLTVETREPEAPPGAAPSPFVELTVSDTGLGMDAETRSHVFEPFFTTKEAGRGTGLGLATVYGIVTGFGGDIQVESEPGRGTTFRIFLPRAEGPSRAASTAPGAAAEVPGGAETILLAEDDDAVRELTRGILRRYGYRVMAARNAGEALLLAEQHAGPIHLLLTDVVMPYLSGPELVQRLAPLRPGMRVVYMSGYTAGHIGRRDSVLPGEVLVTKPFTVEELARAVRGALDAPAPA